jgi:hypothetical protein
MPKIELFNRWSKKVINRPLIIQPINLAVNKPTNWTDLSTNQTTSDYPINQYTNQLTYRLTNQLDNYFRKPTQWITTNRQSIQKQLRFHPVLSSLSWLSIGLLCGRPWFDTRPDDQHSGSWNNWVESAAFVINLQMVRLSRLLW